MEKMSNGYSCNGGVWDSQYISGCTNHDVYFIIAETADTFIERTVHDIRDKYKVTVATNDALEQQTVLSLGALRMSARELKDAIERTSHEGLEGYKTSIKGKLENRSKICERK